MSKTCKTCKYSFSLKSEKEIGKVETVCRRYPPTPVAITAQHPNGSVQVQVMTVYPPMAPEMTCGEHRDAISPIGQRVPMIWDEGKS